jgi:hypothetical protein
MMVERLVFTAVEDGVRFLVQNPDVLVEFLVEEAGLHPDEATKVKDLYVATQGRAGIEERPGPSVVHGYARADTAFPAYAITLGAESENQTFLGDEGAMDDDPESATYGADTFSAIFGYTVNIMVYAQHPDLVLYLYQLLKHALVTAFPLFKQEDLFDLKINGADMAPDPAWVPAGLFLRRLTLNCNRQYRQTQVNTALGRAWKIRGVHIDARGAVGEDVGGVQTQVTFPEDPADE